MKKIDFVCKGCAWRTLVNDISRVKTPRTRKPIPTAIEFLQEVGGKFCDVCTMHKVDCTRNLYYDEIPPITLKEHVFDLCNNCAAQVTLRGTGTGNWSYESEPTWRFPYKILIHKVESQEFCRNCNGMRTTYRVALMPFADDESNCGDFVKKYLGKYK